MADPEDAKGANVVPFSSRKRFGEKPSVFESDQWRDHAFDFDIEGNEPPVLPDADECLPVSPPEPPAPAGAGWRDLAVLLLILCGLPLASLVVLLALYFR